MKLHIEMWDRLTIEQKLVLILEDPRFRNSYDFITNEFYRRNPASTLKKTSLEAKLRTIQNGLWIYPASERVRRARKQKQREIIANYKKPKFCLWNTITWFFK